MAPLFVLEGVPLLHQIRHLLSQNIVISGMECSFPEAGVWNGGSYHVLNVLHSTLVIIEGVCWANINVKAEKWSHTKGHGSI